MKTTTTPEPGMFAMCSATCKCDACNEVEDVIDDNTITVIDHKTCQASTFTKHKDGSWHNKHRKIVFTCFAFPPSN
jgi:hypothetical protein